MKNHPILPVAGFTKPAKAEWHRNDKALVAFFSRYLNLLKAILHRMLHNAMDEEDALQDVYLKMSLKIEPMRFKPLHELRAWLIKIAVNEAIDIINYRKHWMAYTDEQSNALSDYLSPEEQLVIKEKTAAVNLMIESLPEWMKPYIRLRFVYDMSNKEIAAKMDSTENAVRAIIAKAIKRLKKS